MSWQPFTREVIKHVFVHVILQCESAALKIEAFLRPSQLCIDCEPVSYTGRV